MASLAASLKREQIQKARKEAETYFQETKADREGFWELSDKFMSFCYERFPIEMIQLEKDAEWDRVHSLTKYHENSDKSGRIIGTLPARYWHMVTKYYDGTHPIPFRSLHDFNIAFFKRYPQFSYSLKV